MEEDLEFFSDLAKRILKIMEIKLKEKSQYDEKEVVFNAYNREDNYMPPIAMTKADIVIILNDCKDALTNDLNNYSDVVKAIDRTLEQLK